MTRSNDAVAEDPDGVVPAWGLIDADSAKPISCRHAARDTINTTRTWRPSVRSTHARTPPGRPHTGIRACLRGLPPCRLLKDAMAPRRILTVVRIFGRRDFRLAAASHCSAAHYSACSWTGSKPWATAENVSSRPSSNRTSILPMPWFAWASIATTVPICPRKSRTRWPAAKGTSAGSILGVGRS